MTDPISDPAPTLRRDPIERAWSSRAHLDLLTFALARSTNRVELFTHVASRRRPIEKALAEFLHELAFDESRSACRRIGTVDRRRSAPSCTVPGDPFRESVNRLLRP